MLLKPMAAARPSRERTWVKHRDSRSASPQWRSFLDMDEQQRSRQRDETQPWRAWYKTARWQKLKQMIHVRDMYVCQRTGVLCVGKYPADNSPVANHKVPHRGDPKLFWDPDNVETIAKSVHDSEVQREEQASLQMRGCWD
jgi:5-methylcytosine-specific restriction endonuclease McrA